MTSTKFRLALGVCLVGIALASPAMAQRADFTLSVIHSNDGESRRIDVGGTQTAYGGVARFVTRVRQLRDESTDCRNGQGAVLVSSGDNFLAGAQFNASLQRPLGEPFYDLVALDLIGYDASVIGNHEFDFGPDEDRIDVGPLLGHTTGAPFSSGVLRLLEIGSGSLLQLRIGQVRSAGGYRSLLVLKGIATDRS